jgi:hypothetical protein
VRHNTTAKPAASETLKPLLRNSRSHPMAYAELVVVQLEFPEVKETRKAGQSCFFLESHYLFPRNGEKIMSKSNLSRAHCMPIFFIYVFGVDAREQQNVFFFRDVLRIRFEVGNTKIACSCLGSVHFPNVCGIE